MYKSFVIPPIHAHTHTHPRGQATDPERIYGLLFHTGPHARSLLVVTHFPTPLGWGFGSVS